MSGLDRIQLHQVFRLAPSVVLGVRLDEPLPVLHKVMFGCVDFKVIAVFGPSIHAAGLHCGRHGRISKLKRLFLGNVAIGFLALEIVR